MAKTTKKTTTVAKATTEKASTQMAEPVLRSVSLQTTHMTTTGRFSVNIKHMTNVTVEPVDPPDFAASDDRKWVEIKSAADGSTIIYPPNSMQGPAVSDNTLVLRMPLDQIVSEAPAL